MFTLKPSRIKEQFRSQIQLQLINKSCRGVYLQNIDSNIQGYHKKQKQKKKKTNKSYPKNQNDNDDNWNKNLIHETTKKKKNQNPTPSDP